MDITTIAATAITLLAPYLTKSGEAAAKVVGEKLVEKAGALYQIIKNKFRGDPYAEQSLVRVEEKPDSEVRKATLIDILVEKMAEDAKFAEAVNRLVEETKPDRSVTILASGNRSVAVGRDVTGSTITTGDKKS